MKKNVVPKKIAKLAKEKGFDLRVHHTYNQPTNSFDAFVDGDTTVNTDSFNANSHHSNYISAPDRNQLQRWLRERHDQIHVNVFVSEHPDGCIFSVTIFEKPINKLLKEIKISKIGVWEETYEEALDIGLFKALKLIP